MKAKIIFKRYIYVFLLNLVAVSLYILFESRFQTVDYTVTIFTGIGVYSNFILHVVCFLFIYYFLSVTRSLSYKSIKRALLSPPIWAPVPISIFMVLYIKGFYGAEVSLLMPYTILLAVSFLSSIFIFYFVNRRQTALQRVMPDEGNGHGIMEWVVSESPILSSKEDLLGFSAKAKRFAEDLALGHANSVCLVGGYGTGKSSFSNVTAEYLKEEINVQIVRFDSWGRSTETISRQILHSIVDGLSEHVDCTSISSIPSKYARLMKGTKLSLLGAIFSFLNRELKAEELFDELDVILVDNELNILLLVEDLDRNCDERQIKEEIPALIDKIRLNKRIKIILTIGPESSHIHLLNRICDKVELMS